MNANATAPVTTVEAPMLTGTPGVKERNLGIDLLRMVSMLLVVILHVLGQGGVLSATGKSDPGTNYRIAWFLEIAAYCAVNCYGLISGYVGVRSKFKYTNIIMLWLQVFFYTGIITLLFSIFHPAYFEVGEEATELIWKAFLPAVKNQYWYFTAYFAMFFFIPFYNHAINNMPKKQIRAVVIAGIVLFSVLPLLFRAGILGKAVSNVFYISGGYNMMWLSVLYVTGAYISKYHPFEKIPTYVFFLVYLAAAVGAWFCKFYLQGGGVTVHYTSPFMLVEGVALLEGFSRLKLKPVGPVIRFLSPAAFGVYLVHVHPLIWEEYMKHRYVEFATFGTAKMIFAIFAAVLGIYLFCSAIDLCRHYLFQLLHIRKGLTYLENKFCKNLW